MFSRTRRWRPHRPPIDEVAALRLRLLSLRLVVVLAFVILSAQLWQLQMARGAAYRQRAESNRLRLFSIPAPRGVIYDRQGRLLVRNVPNFSVAITPADLPKDQESAVISQLSGLLKTDAGSIATLVERYRQERRLFEPVVVKADVSPEVAFALEEHRDQLPGVSLLAEAKRQYLAPEAGAILGYVGSISAEDYPKLQAQGYDIADSTGKMGIELAYESQLRGRPGREQVEVDVYGQKVATLATEEPQPGHNLTLTIDLDLQQAMAKYLGEAMGPSNFAAAIAMNPKTGEILGLVSLPSFDPNLFSSPNNQAQIEALLRDPRRPLLNYAVAGAFPPGSVFKPVVAAAALQEGVANPRTRIVSTGSITIPNPYNPSAVTVMKDWAALGPLDFYQAIAQSSDVYFYYLAGGFEDFKGLGPERIASYARNFGLGEKTGIDLPDEAKGMVPDPAWKEDFWKEPWYLGDTYNYGIGQGYLMATPLQMLQMVAAVANEGTLVQPMIVREVQGQAGESTRPSSPKPKRQVAVTSKNLDVVREGMRQAVEWGTAWQAQLPGVKVAGKTGTAEFGSVDPRTGLRPSHGWFVAFAPFDDPEIALVVFQEHGAGSSTAAPVARKILRAYFEKRGLISPQAPTEPSPPAKSGTE